MRGIALRVAVAVGCIAAVTASAPAGSAAPAPIARSAFGMHFLGYGSRPYPTMPFGSARLWDTSVSWAHLQPTSTPLSQSAPTPGVQRLDAMVKAFRAHGVQPLIVLGMTPAWAAAACAHGDWPATTCGPRATGSGSAWAAYVRFLAHRYRNVYFETWNEPNLRNGWNDTVRKLAAMQATAYSVIHAAGTGDRLISPTVAITAGHPLRWLHTFFHSPGGKRFDVMAVHLYPSDASARAGYGPEWSVDYLNQKLRPLLRAHGVSTTVWDTEANVGRRYVGIAFSGMTAAGLVTRTYALQLSNRVTRIFWYAADERNVTGVWLVKADYKSLTYAGLAERTAYRLLLGARPYGCTRAGTGVVRYACAFHLRTGKNAMVRWTTGGTAYIRAPAHTSGIYSAVGGYRSARGGARVRLTPVPQYLVGTFPL